MEINRGIIYRLSFFTAALVLAILIVWYPPYFYYGIAGFIALLMLVGKTRESLVALIFYLPFQIALNVTSDIDMASSRVIISALFIVWLLKALAAKRLRVPDSFFITAFMIIFTALAAISAIFSIAPDRAYVRLLYFFSIIPLYFVSAYYLRSVFWIKKVFGVLAASGALAAFFGVVQFAGQFIFGIDPVINFMAKNIAAVFYGQSFSGTVLANPSWLVNIGGETYFRAISLFPDPHMFAFYLGLVMPVAVVLFLRAGAFGFSDKTKIFLLAVNAILLLALGFTFSRAGYIGAVFGFVAVFALSWNFLDRKVKFLAAAVSFAVVVGLLFSSNAIINRFFDVFNPSEGSNSERLANWAQAVKIIEDHPLTGVGAGAYALAVDPRSPVRSAITAHNTYLDIAAEMGVLALIVWVAMLGTALRKLLVISRNKIAANKEAAALSAGLAGAFVWFSVQSVFDTAIYSPTLFAILMVYLAITVNLGENGIPFKKNNSQD